jgi:chromosome partitioning protein
MAISITLVCNKGGVGRSTTAQNVGWKLAKMKYKVLIVDLDSQANTSITLCKDYESLVITADKSITAMLKSNDKYFTDYIVPTRHKNLDLLASSWELDMTESIIRNETSPNTQLRDRLDSFAKEKYDFIIYDTPPRKTDKFIHNALIISDYYWYIVSAENRWALDAKPIMDKTIKDVCESMGANIKPIPALLTLFRRRNALSGLVLEQCRKIFDYGIMEATIRDTTEMRKSSAMYKTIYEYNHRAEVAKDYTKATEELIVLLRANQHELNFQS